MMNHSKGVGTALRSLARGDLVMTGEEDAILASLLWFWPFSKEIKGLPLRDSWERLSLLCALLEASLYLKTAQGVSIAWIADRIDVSRENARHHVRTLRADGAVRIATKIGRTELFEISEPTKVLLIECLAGPASALEALQTDALPRVALPRRG